MSDVLTRFHQHASEDAVTIERIQDVEPILEYNHFLRSLSQKSDWGRHKAKIPNVIYERWFNEYNEGRSTPDLRIFGPEFSEYVNKKLNDPEWAYLRVDK